MRNIKASHFKENNFPFPELTKVSGTPNYTDILTLRRQVNANLASVPSHLGGGNFGHLALGHTTTSYLRVTNSTTPFVRPTDPGAFLAGNSTGPDLAIAKQVHDEEKEEFLVVNVLEQAILNQLRAALETFVLLPKTCDITGLITCSIPDIFEYLFRAYGNITSTVLADARHKCTQVQYVHNQPMESVFTKINEYANMAEAYGLPESDRQLVEIGTVIILNAVIFADDLHEWREKPTTDQTWKNFRTHFINAQTKYKKNRPAETSSSLGYAPPPSDTVPQANVLQAEDDLAAANEYIAQLEAIQQANALSPAPSAPTGAAPDPMQELIAKIAALQLEIQACKAVNDVSPPSVSNKKKKVRKEKSERKYCWTHGACAHNGSECNHPKEGHKKDATFSNRMEGSTKDCFWLSSSSA
jgi:hypothetical protein